MKNLSLLEKVVSSVTKDILQVMGIGFYTLNKVVHSADSEVEMVHAMNNIRDHTRKTMWQAFFTYVYDKDSVGCWICVSSFFIMTLCIPRQGRMVT